MIIFLYGKDIYRLIREKNRFIISKTATSISYFEFLQDNHLPEIEDLVRSSSFFDDSKVLIIRDIFRNKLYADGIIKVIETYSLSDSKDTTLVFIEGLSASELRSKNKNYFSYIAKTAGIKKEFNPLNGRELINWIEEEFKLREKDIDTELIRKLIAINGSDSWALVNEIDKLSSYAKGRSINKIDIDRLVIAPINLNIFDLVDSVLVYDKNKAFEVLYKELRSGRDPNYILAMIIYQLRNLLIVRDLYDRKASLAVIQKKSGLHPFVAKKAFYKAKNFDIKELKLKYSDLLDIDIKSKQGLSDITDSLFKFFLS